MRFKLAVNTRLLQKNKLEGIGRFAYENLKRMVKDNPEIEFHFLFDRKYDSEFIFGDNVVPHVIGIPTRHIFLQVLWFHWTLPKFLKKIKADAFFSPEGANIPKGKTPSFITQHDLGFIHRPNDLPSLAKWYYRRFFPKYSQDAERIFTVSNFSKEDLIREFKIDKDKITVCYNGNEHLVKSESKKDFSRPYFLYVGSLHQRKNIIHTLKSFELFKGKYKTDHQLVIVGKKMFNDTESEKYLQEMKYSSDIVFTGYVDDMTLSSFYSEATALINLSYFEGFGIPIIEAYINKIPAVVSNRSCFPEIAGPGALFSEPEDLELIASHLYDLAMNTELRERLGKQGYEHAKSFKWEDSAKTIIQEIKGNG